MKDIEDEDECDFCFFSKRRTIDDEIHVGPSLWSWLTIILVVQPSGLMDKASASEAGDCGFKSHLGW